MTAEPQHVLVTGSTRGIGRAIAEGLIERGSSVVGHGRTDMGNVLGADLAEPGAAEDLWARALERLRGRIDVLINNAGVYDPIAVDAEAAAWRAAWTRTLQINLQASADLCRLAVLHWRAQGRPGRIVNVASRAAWRGDSLDYWHYGASKAGMVAMTRSIARAYAAEGILAFAVCPGFVATEMAETHLGGAEGARIVGEIPLGRVTTPEEVANATVYLALDAPSSMTGAALDINGGSYVR